MNLQKTNIIKLLSILIFLGFWASSAVAIEMDIAALQKEIDAKGYKWRAGKTSLSDLSSEESIKLFSRYPCDPLYMMPPEKRITLPNDFPTYLDWRNYKGGNWITPVKNQQPRCGSCQAFGQLGTMETLIRLHYDDPTLTIDLSEQYVVSCAPKGLMCDNETYLGGCKGNWADIVLDFLMDSGVPDEACFPYKSRQRSGTEPPCTNVCSDVSSRVHKISSYSFIGSDMLAIPYPENIKVVLVNKPVAAQMIINPLDWMFYTGGIYEPTPGPRAGHVFEIIGYDDDQQCWIGKNSQGTNWGETADFKPYTRGANDGGYFRVAYVNSVEESETYVGLCAVDVNYAGGPPVTTSTTTTTTICPMIEIYGNDAEETHLLRSFRDKVLTKTPEGKKFIELYYRWSPAVVKILQENASFKAAVKKRIDKVLPVIKEKQQ